MQTVQRLHSTNSDQRRDDLAEWHRVHTVIPATHTFIHEWNEPSCTIYKLVLPVLRRPATVSFIGSIRGQCHSRSYWAASYGSCSVQPIIVCSTGRTMHATLLISHVRSPLCRSIDRVSSSRTATQQPVSIYNKQRIAGRSANWFRATAKIPEVGGFTFVFWAPDFVDWTCGGWRRNVARITSEETDMADDGEWIIEIPWYTQIGTVETK